MTLSSSLQTGRKGLEILPNTDQIGEHSNEDQHLMLIAIVVMSCSLPVGSLAQVIFGRCVL